MFLGTRIPNTFSPSGLEILKNKLNKYIDRGFDFEQTELSLTDKDDHLTIFKFDTYVISTQIAANESICYFKNERSDQLKFKLQLKQVGTDDHHGVAEILAIDLLVWSDDDKFYDNF